MLSLAGCWDRIEVNDLALIMAAGLDKPDEKNIELSAQIYIPKASAGGDQSGMTVRTQLSLATLKNTYQRIKRASLHNLIFAFADFG